MSGITFFRTLDLKKIKEFYLKRMEMRLWQDQGDCIILKKGNLLLGFCERSEADTTGIITLFYLSKAEVDSKYNELQNIALQTPAVNKKYNIYQFFARDPEGRMLEFQSFCHPLNPYLDGNELLVSRRSIREFEKSQVSRETLSEIFEVCRYSPTSRNSQSYYFVVVDRRDHHETIEFLGSVLGESSAPIARAPLAIAICADSSKTGAPEQDACIAAYHFLLASFNHGLGTCWIAAMDRDDVKEQLGIPKEHYVATVTPLGYPKEMSVASERRKANEIVRFFDDS